MKVSTEIDNNFGYEKITQLVDNIPLNSLYYRWNETVHFLFCDGQFYWWKNLEKPGKTTDLPQVTDKHYHIEITLVLLPINNSQATVDEK